MKTKKFLERLKVEVDTYLDKLLPPDTVYPSVIHEAMRYSIFAGGKRIRPILLLVCYQATGGKEIEKVMPFACALELIHTYSLIHDDLPAMDNDDLRRGKPTSHKVFGEAIAILAGDGLFSHAYYLMTLTDVNKNRLLDAIKTISNAVGSLGIVGGQTMDIKMKGEKPDPKTLRYIHSRKTACFISASCEIGGILAGTSKKKREALRKGGLYLGMAFQIIDDLLDVIGDEKKVGKRLRKDKDKVTYPALYGIDGSRFRAKAYTELAIRNFQKLGNASDKLIEISKYLEQRMF